MKINAIKCESCAHAHDIDMFRLPSELQLPPTWLVVYSGGLESKEGFHFCSKSCLHQWLMKTSPEATQPLVEVSSSTRLVTITKWATNEDEARRLAEHDYDYFLQASHPLLVVVKKTVSVFKELRAIEGLVGYHIVAECEPKGGEKS